MTSGLSFSSLSDYSQVAPKLKQFTARDGGQLTYRAYKSVNKDTAIILLHGSSAHGEYLHPLAEKVKIIGKVIVPNLRGHYASGSNRGDCSYIGQLEDDFFDLITCCGLQDKKIYVIGHSSGGGLAIRLAGGLYGDLIKGFVLLSPAIPTAPTLRQNTAGGWAKVSIWKIIALSILNCLGIRFLNHRKVIEFNRPPDRKATLAYSYCLNTSCHPRLPYKKDIAALKGKSIVVVGSEDEANDPLHYPKVMQDPESKTIQIVPGAKHLNLVEHPAVFSIVIHWIKMSNNCK